MRHGECANEGMTTLVSKSGKDVASEELQIALTLSPRSPISLAHIPVRIDLTARPLMVLLTGHEPNVWMEGQMLLEWFAQQSQKKNKDHPIGDQEARLSFPPRLSKDDRLKWHKMSEKCNLASSTQGQEPNRLLYIFTRGCKIVPCEELGLGSSTYDVWLACHLDGSDLIDHDPTEIQEMTSKMQTIPGRIKEAYTVRQHVRDLAEHLRNNAQSKALEVIEHTPQVLTKLEESCMGYPIHLACALGRREIVQCMCKIGHDQGQDVTKLRDSQQKTPAQVARDYGNIDIATDIDRHQSDSRRHHGRNATIDTQTHVEKKVCTYVYTYTAQSYGTSHRSNNNCNFNYNDGRGGRGRGRGRSMRGRRGRQGRHGTSVTPLRRRHDPRHDERYGYGGGGEMYGERRSRTPPRGGGVRRGRGVMVVDRREILGRFTDNAFGR